MTRSTWRSPVDLLCLLAVLAMLSCSADNSESDKSVAGYLPENLGSAGRSDEARVFVGESLWEYINGDAEIYHQYGFEEVATADYVADGQDIVVDVYRFASNVGAYGLYTAVRPDDPDLIELGVQGFIASSALTFVKADVVVRLTAFKSSDTTADILRRVADELAAAIPGTVDPPELFTLFPGENQVPAGDRIYAASFQGQAFLTDFYSQKYELGGDTVEVFFTADAAQEKFRQWSEAVAGTGPDSGAARALPFDKGMAMVTETFYGPLVVGVSDDYLAGMMNYSDDKREFLATWLESLPE